MQTWGSAVVRGSPVTTSLQPELFPQPTVEAAPAADAFADIVFDRPLDHAYSYAVPARLRDRVAIGKRVAAPFGRGNRQTVGFCVGMSATPPSREVKEITRVLDDDALLTPHLLRLTRW